MHNVDFMVQMLQFVVCHSQALFGYRYVLTFVTAKSAGCVGVYNADSRRRDIVFVAKVPGLCICVGISQS